MQHKRKIIGSFEPITFPDFQVEGMMAKIDTGAYTGALHCTQVREEDTPQGKVLHFSPFDQPEREISTTGFAIKFVRSSNGVEQRRYFIDTSILIRGQAYPIVLSLADRSDMRWPVLIGRKFLRQNNFLVDASKGYKYGGQQDKTS